MEKKDFLKGTLESPRYLVVDGEVRGSIVGRTGDHVLNVGGQDYLIPTTDEYAAIWAHIDSGHALAPGPSWVKTSTWPKRFEISQQWEGWELEVPAWIPDAIVRIHRAVKRRRVARTRRTIMKHYRWVHGQLRKKHPELFRDPLAEINFLCAWWSHGNLAREGDWSPVEELVAEEMRHISATRTVRGDYQYPPDWIIKGLKLDSTLRFFSS